MADHFEFEDMINKLRQMELENACALQDIKNIRYLLGLGDWATEAMKQTTKENEDEKETN